MSLSIKNNQEMIDFDQKKLELLRSSMCKDATQEEFEVFVEICKATQLNPLFRQIYFIKRGGKPTHQTSIDGLRLIADRTGKYMPGREPTFTYDKNGDLYSATSYVKKLASDGTWHEVAATAIVKEYRVDNNALWKKMEHTMAAKCAEAIAIRKGFPADTNKIYIKEEMDQAEVEILEDNHKKTSKRHLNTEMAIDDRKSHEELRKDFYERFDALETEKGILGEYLNTSPDPYTSIRKALSNPNSFEKVIPQLPSMLKRQKEKKQADKTKEQVLRAMSNEAILMPAEQLSLEMEMANKTE